MKVTLTEPEVAGSYVVVERRPNGTLVLEPARERLSAVIAETEGKVFRDEEFLAHLERVAATEDDLPPNKRAWLVPTFERGPRFDREFRRLSRELQRAFLAALPMFIESAARQAARLPAFAARQAGGGGARASGS